MTSQEIDYKTRVKILGVPVSPINLGLAGQIIKSWIDRKEKHYVCVRDVNGIVECQFDPNYLKIHEEAGLVTPDGMPVVWLTQMKGYKECRRTYGPDLMMHICELSLKNEWGHFFYGSSEAVLKDLTNNLKKRFPTLKINGFLSPPYRTLTEAEISAHLEVINHSNSEILWVGLGSPKQEYWMHSSIQKLQTNVVLGVGAAFDFHAGHKKQAPVWIQKSGLEWFFRLCTEPKRLAKRYIVRVPLFLVLLFLHSLGLYRKR